MNPIRSHNDNEVGSGFIMKELKDEMGHGNIWMRRINFSVESCSATFTSLALVTRPVKLKMELKRQVMYMRRVHNKKTSNFMPEDPV
jgi:hypothetical protein